MRSLSLLFVDVVHGVLCGEKCQEKLMRHHLFFSKYGKKNKYGNKRTKCRLGHTHDSGLESEYCFQLQMRQRAKEIKSFEYERTYDLRVNDQHITFHRPDFIVLMPDGSEEFHEVKGHENDLWRVKSRLLQALHPDINYHLIK